MRFVALLAALASLAVALAGTASAQEDAALLADVKKLAGDGVVVVLDAEGNSLVSLNAERSFIPASSLKVVTALAAMEILGTDYHFTTGFYVDEAGVLYIEGRGDPYLISEELDLLAPKLLATGKTEFTEVVLDASYFDGQITIPGVTKSDNPYDALNSALAVNFNTIFVVITGSNITTAEEQTPVVPLARQVAVESGRSGKVRINLTDSPERSLQYAGEMIRAKLIAHGATIGEGIREGKVPQGLEPFYVHSNSRPVSEVVAGCLHYSNNYIANQLVLEMGVARFGEPATLDKGVRAVHEVLEKHELTDGLTYVEGSGISRDNSATAAVMVKLLKEFAPHKELMRDRRGALAKTGSLSITKTIIGYLETDEHGEVLFVFGLGGGYWNQRFDLIDLLKGRL